MKSLAVRYRPTTFDECIGQSNVTKILSRQLEMKSYKNAYLFCGPSGCGKTTSARIFANGINNGNGFPIEIDAASNSGVDNVRNIIRDAGERSIDSEYKIYIIDECHALSTQSWQAFLKCIEETPKYTIFIFCTTDHQKVPETINNRCQRFEFHRVSSDEISNRLSYICTEEGIKISPDALEHICKLCEGSVRKAITLLEKCTDYTDGEITLAEAREAIGEYKYNTMFALVNALIEQKQDKVFEISDKMYSNGVDISIFVNQFLVFLLGVKKYILFKNLSVTPFTEIDVPSLEYVTNFDGAIKFYDYYVDTVLEMKSALKSETDYKSAFEAWMLKMARRVKK